MSGKNLQTNFEHTAEEVKDSNGNLLNASMMLAASTQLQYINVTYKLEKNAIPKLVGNANSETGYIELVQDVLPEGLSDLNHGDIIVVTMLRNTEQVERLFSPLALLKNMQVGIVPRVWNLGLISWVAHFGFVLSPVYINCSDINLIGFIRIFQEVYRSTNWFTETKCPHLLSSFAGHL